MSTLSLRLPNSLHDKIKELAKEEGISINQFIASPTTHQGRFTQVSWRHRKRQSRYDGPHDDAMNEDNVCAVVSTYLQKSCLCIVCGMNELYAVN